MEMFSSSVAWCGEKDTSPNVESPLTKMTNVKKGVLRLSTV